MHDNLGTLMLLAGSGIQPVTTGFAMLIKSLLLATAFVFTVIAGFDMLIQRKLFTRQQMMTKDEVTRWACIVENVVAGTLPPDCALSTNPDSGDTAEDSPAFTAGTLNELMAGLLFAKRCPAARPGPGRREPGPSPALPNALRPPNGTATNR
ncbi:MAG: EscU/YscU/HrcU family type III secretion system export apparatus switch protein [Alphaproteobacteria bacterium]|nr:EscU/YscU/HrcU family type III secretion system export apparatus switch protein [Alphaproteobacteria bacterium]